MFRIHATKRKTAKFLNCIGGRCVGVGNANECEINKNKLTQGIFLATIPIIKKKKKVKIQIPLLLRSELQQSLKYLLHRVKDVSLTCFLYETINTTRKQFQLYREDRKEEKTKKDTKQSKAKHTIITSKRHTNS